MNPRKQFLNKAIKKFAIALMEHEGRPFIKGTSDEELLENHILDLKDILMVNPFVNGKPKYELSNYLVDMICEEDIITDTKMANKLEKIYKTHKEKGLA